jgi:hypothetical protein
MLIIPAARALHFSLRSSVADPGLERLFAELEATFEASVAREEEAAAADLGFAFAQTKTLQQVLPRLPYGVVLIGEGVATPVAQIGTDFVVTHPPVQLIPLERAVLRVAEEGVPPSACDSSLLLALRRIARQRVSVEIQCGDEYRRSGLLLSAGEDFVTLREVAGQVFVPLKSVGAIRLLGDPRSLGF